MPLPFTVVTARGPDGLPRLPRLRIARQRKKRKSKTSACGALAFFFRLAPAALPRLRAWARLRRRTCRRLVAAFRLRPWLPRPSPRGGAFPPLRSGGLCAAPYGRRFFTPFAPPNKIKTFGLCVFLYACGAAFAFLISTLRRNLFVSPPSAPLSPRGERGKPIAIFLLDISLPRNYNKCAGHTIVYVDNVIPTGYGSALSIKNPPAFAGGFFICFYSQLYKMGRYCAIRSYFANDSKQFILYN